MIKQIIREAMDRNPIGLKEALEEELKARVALALEAKMEELEQIDEGLDLSENFKRGDVIEVPGSGNTKHKAVMLTATNAVYLEDDGSVERVPDYALNKAIKAKRVSKDEKELAKEFLANMKESEEHLDEVSKKTLGSYIKKSKESLATNRQGFSDALRKPGYTYADRKYFGKKASNREKGIDRAVDRLTKEEFEQIDESAKKYGVDTGPLMKANAWIKPQKLSKMVDELKDENETGNFAVGTLSKPGGKPRQIAIPIRNVKPEVYFKKGMGKPHTFYYDTGRGHRQTQEEIVITGMITIEKDGNVKTSGKADMNANTTLMVFK